MLGTQMEQTEGDKKEERLEKKRGNEGVWELMLTTDVCHSSLIAVTLFLALYQTYKEEEHVYYTFWKLISETKEKQV